jgi:hypothetical protein
MKEFSELTKSELWELRNEIELDSIYISEFKNSFGYHPYSVCMFFDGYLSYLQELAESEFENPTYFDALSLDSAERLYDWFNCYDDFSWVKTLKNDDGENSSI